MTIRAPPGKDNRDAAAETAPARSGSRGADVGTSQAEPGHDWQDGDQRNPKASLRMSNSARADFSVELAGFG
jgi:hypothetical protein